MSQITQGDTIPQPNGVGGPPTDRGDATIGVAAARAWADSSSATPARPQIFDEFKLARKVGLVTGGDRGLGLEMALALAEQGATVYCCDLRADPSDDFEACREYARSWGARMEYRRADVTDQPAMRELCREITDKEGALDVCVAAAGILDGTSCLEYPIEDFQRIMNVNTNGVFITASAAASHMARLKIPGSIIMIASMSGSLTNRGHDWIAYNTSKSAVLQMARSMACELGPLGIRVNSISPGHVKTAMTDAFLEKFPELEQKWSGMNPLGRLGKTHEVRGVVAWLSSDASSFCTGSDILVS